MGFDDLKTKFLQAKSLIQTLSEAKPEVSDFSEIRVPKAPLNSLKNNDFRSFVVNLSSLSKNHADDGPIRIPIFKNGLAGN